MLTEPTKLDRRTKRLFGGAYSKTSRQHCMALGWLEGTPQLVDAVLPFAEQNRLIVLFGDVTVHDYF